MMNRMKSERGSVMLEFCLMLPIWLLIFGGTFLIFDVSMGRLHLQETNRNLAWIQNDRFDRGDKINKELYRRATLFYDIRNTLENNLSDEPMWVFGQQNKKDRQGNVSSWLWGKTDGSFEQDDISLDLSLVGNALANNWAMICSGNMELKMKKISAVYLGPIAVSGVLTPNDDTEPFYQKKYPFTFTRSVDENGNPMLHNGEMMVLRKKDLDKRREIKDVNGLLEDMTIYRAWPSSGLWDKIGTSLGVGI